MYDNVIRCDLCLCIIEREPIKVHNKDYCKECYINDFKEIHLKLLKQFIDDLPYEDMSELDKKVIKRYLDIKFKEENEK